MFAKITRVKKGDKTFQYLRIMRSFRQGGKIHQEVIANLGELSTIDPLIQNILRVLRKNEEIQSLSGKGSYIWGPILVARHFWKKLSVGKSIDKTLSRREKKIYGVPTIDIAFALAAARLVDPSSEHRLASVFERSYIIKHDGTRWLPMWVKDGINDKTSEDRVKVQWKRLNVLYKSLDVLYKHKAQIEENLFNYNKDLFSAKLDLVLYDITSAYFEGRGPSTIAKHGYSRDGKRRNTQIVLGLLMLNGLPVAHHVFAGNTADKSTVQTIVKDLSARFDVKRVVFIMDSGMVSKENLECINKLSHDYVVSLPRRRSSEVRKIVEKFKSDKNVVMTDVKRGVRICEMRIRGSNTRYFMVDSQERRKYEASIREGCIAKGRDILSAIKKEVDERHLVSEKKIIERVASVHKYHVNRYFSWEIREAKFQYEVDKVKLEWEKEIEGRYFLKTTSKKLSAVEVANSYLQLCEIEDSFREIKSVCQVRPIFHKTENRVKAHVFVAVLSFLLERAMQRELSAQGVTTSTRDVLDELATLHVVEVEANGKTHNLVTQPTQAVSRFLKMLKVTNLKPSPEPLL